MPVEPWFSYPPDMNAGRFEGPGPATWFASGSKWAADSAQVATALARFMGQKGIQATQIYGVSSAAQLGAAGAFGSWLGEQSALGGVHGAAEEASASAYTTARASMIPVPAVEANRTAWASAVSSSILGAADPTAVALNAQYAQMWAQNAATMGAYDTAVTSATTFKPPTPAIPLMNNIPGESTAQTAARLTDALQQQGTSSPSQQQAIQGMTQVIGMLGSTGGQLLQLPAQFAQQLTSGLQQVMTPVQQVMSQLATPMMNNVMGNGLGTGSGALGSTMPRSSGGLRGGLPLGNLMGGGGLGSGKMGGLGSMQLSESRPITSTGRIGPQFSGVSLSERSGVPNGERQQQGTPMGGVGGMGGARGGAGGSGRDRGAETVSYREDTSTYRDRRDRRSPRTDNRDSMFD